MTTFENPFIITKLTEEGQENGIIYLQRAKPSPVRIKTEARNPWLRGTDREIDWKRKNLLERFSILEFQTPHESLAAGGEPPRLPRLHEASKPGRRRAATHQPAAARQPGTHPPTESLPSFAPSPAPRPQTLSHEGVSLIYTNGSS